MRGLPLTSFLSETWSILLMELAVKVGRVVALVAAVAGMVVMVAAMAGMGVLVAIVSEQTYFLLPILLPVVLVVLVVVVEEKLWLEGVMS